jgi:uncharacterized lipoprotein YmbA
MRRNSGTIRRILPLVLISVMGCFSLSRNAPAPQHFVLGGSAPHDETVSRDPDRIAVGVRRLRLAPYLATPFVVVRRGANRITFSEFQRWGEDPGVGINRAVAGYLAARAPFADLDMAPWPLGTPHEYLIQLGVTQFEGVAPEALSAVEGEAHMLATWEIMGQDGAVLARGTTDYRAPGWKIGDYGGLVALLDAGLDALASDLATRLETLARDR